MAKLEIWRGLLKCTPEECLPNLSKFSQSWCNCAVGEKLGFPGNNRKELEDLITEKDEVLDALGSAFYQHITSGNKKAALSVLRKIENHEVSADILMEINDRLIPTTF